MFILSSTCLLIFGSF